MTIDELVVSLILDPSKFLQGQKDATAAAQKGATDVAAAATKGEKAQTEAHKRASDSANRLAVAVLAGNKKIAESFEGAIRTSLTFLAVLAGAKGIEDFTRKVTALDAAIGRMAQGLGQSPETLSGIGRAAERLGGSFDGAVGGLRGLSDAFQQLRTTGNNAIMEPLARLQALSGKAIRFGKDVHENFLSIADALHAESLKDPALADFLGRQILGDEGLVTLAKKGRSGVLAEEAESRRHGVITPEDAKAAQDLQRAYNGLSQTIVALGTRIETRLSPFLSDLLTKLGAWIDKNKDLIANDVLKWAEQFTDWLKDHQSDIADFASAVAGIASAAGAVATAFTGQSPMMVALAAFAAFMGGTMLRSVTSVLSVLTKIGSIPVTGALAAVLGAKYLSDHTMSNVDPWADQSPGETALRALDPGAADRVYGKRGEQLPHGPRHGVGVKAAPHDTRTLWQRMAPKWAGGKDAPTRGDDTQGNQARPRSTGRNDGIGDARAPVSSANAPGANGYGLINAPYTASVDRKGERGILSPRELFDYLKSRGATDNEATMLTGAAGNESSYNPEANHDPDRMTGRPTGHGLWGHKHDRIDMRGMTWQQQADAALAETRDKRYAGRIAAARTPQELADAEMFYEGPRGFKSNNPRGGDNYTGRLRTIDSQSRAFGTLGQGAQAQPTPTAPIGDQAVLDARRRIADGKGTQADRDLIRRYIEQQNTPPAKSAAKPINEDDRETRARAWTVKDAVKAAVEEHQAKSGSDMLHDRRWGGFKAGVHHKLKHALHPDEALLENNRGLVRSATDSRYHHNPVTHNNSSETKIGSVTIHTQATDARGMVADIRPLFDRAAAAGRANYGQA